MSAFDLQPDLARQLDRLVPAEPLSGDWADVLRRVRPAQRRRRVVPLKLALALAGFLALAAIATATYLALTGSDSSSPRPGALTVVAGGGNSGGTGAAQIVEVVGNGQTRVVWHCPHNVFCGDLTSVDWSPDGRHVAFTLDEIGGSSAYIGLHILDVASGRDIHIPSVKLAHPLAAQPMSIFSRLLRQERQRLGCEWPGGVDWSPDGSTLAYSCNMEVRGVRRGVMFTIRSDGTGHRRIGTLLDGSGPSWSPDGKRITFTGLTAARHTAIYVSRADGSNRVLIARSGWGPDWSPDGKTIAYRADDGIRLVTPNGVDVTPNGKPIAPKGLPAWSPDGKTIAVGTQRGVYLVEKTGAHLRRATTLGRGVIGTVRPAWYPADSVRGEHPTAKECGPC